MSDTFDGCMFCCAPSSSSSDLAATKSSVTLLMIEEILPSSVKALYPTTVSKG